MAGCEILTPRTQDELVELVRACGRDQAPVFVTGHASAPDHVTGPARVISTRLLKRVIALEPGDLTLTAECGLTIAAAQEALGAHRQFVALDPPDPGAATLGGVIAAGQDGPMAARFGMTRDQVLGLTVVNGDGKVTHCGGRVVKNVTGYDLCRLYTGSGGGLGIILEATVRVRPLPEITSSSIFMLPDEATAFERAFEIRRRIPEIAGVQVTIDFPRQVGLGTSASGSRSLVLAIEREVADVMRGFHSTRGSLGFSTPPGYAVVRVTALPSRLVTLHSDIEALLSPSVAIDYDVLRGVRQSRHLREAPVFLDDHRLDALLAKLGATIDCPTDPGFPATLATRFPGQVPGGLALMRSLKAALDPAGILNPGGTVFG